VIGIIDRYISKQFLGVFLGALVALVCVFVAVDGMSTMFRFEAEMSALAAYYGYSLPAILHQLLPVAALMATVFTLNSMNRNNELVSLFSYGMSLGRISIPILTWVCLISLVAYWLGDRILPVFNQKKNYVYYVEIRKKPWLYSTVKMDKIWYRSKNTIFNLKTFNIDAKRAQGATFYEFNDQWDLLQVIQAKNVALEGSNWHLTDGNVTLFVEENSFPLLEEFDQKVISIDENLSDLQANESSSSVLSTSELKRFIRRNKEAGLDTTRYEVDYHAKFGFAFATFVMAFLGIPFSVGNSRSGGFALNVGKCIGLGFGYWALYSSGITLGQHGALPPLLAAWLPNLLMVAITFFLLLRLKK
jgi:lipopolysaccharide export system permease protein